MEQLWSCKLGYRARHVAATARCLAESPGLLDRVAALDYPAAREELMDLPGVGGKVADCVLLYGSPSLRPFPSDTWILQAMARLYGLEGWRPEQVGTFGRAHFGEAAGLAQQFLFVRARRGSLKA
jgi:N-glycosylase/DNA lyase